MTTSCSSPIRLRRCLLVAALGLAATSCARLPRLPEASQPKPALAYATRHSFEAAAAAWPAQRWWEAYGDTQLDALVAEALRDSPDLAAAEARLRRAEAFGATARAALGPQIAARGTVSSDKLSYNHIMAREFTPQGWNEYGRLSLDLNWELDFWGRNRAGLAAAGAQTEAARAELAAVRLNLAAAVAAEYADFARLFAVRDSAQSAVQVRQRSAELFAARFGNGLETRGSLAEAQARLAAAEGELLAVDEDIALARNRLAALLGAGPDRGRALTRPAVDLAQGFGLPDELAVDLLGRRPDIVAARLLVEAQQQHVVRARAEFYPNVNLNAFIGVQSLGLDLLGKAGSDVGSVGPAISLPIFTAGRLQGQLRAAAAGHDEAVAGYDRTVTHALREVADVALSRRALDARLDKARDAVAAAGDAHRVATDRYAGGLATALDVLFAEDGLLAARRHLAILQSRAFALDVALQRALGGGYESPRV